MFTKSFLVFLLAAMPLASGATEFADRSRINAEMQMALIRETFAETQAAYNQASNSNARLESGTFRADHMLYGLDQAIKLQKLHWKMGKVTEAEKQTPQFKEEAIVAMEEKALRWLKADPKSSLAGWVASDIYIDHAFFYRGGGWARDVEKDQWKKYELYLAKAREVLLSPQMARDAAWYCAMLKLSQFDKVVSQDYEKLVKEASSRFPNSHAIYAMAARPLQPKWGGSVEAYEWLANLAVSATQKTDGMGLYARVYWNISVFESHSELFTTTRVDWKKMNQGFEDMHKRYPSDWNLNYHARFACYAKDGATLKNLFVRLEGKWDPMAWSEPDFLARCRRLAKDA